ncbi:MAG: class I SAM-dependent methyltransferase [Pseudomonadota bacterium]|nr:class I SAM-dependent methyltransferase [Pseudomonadota bacterium]
MNDKKTDCRDEGIDNIQSDQYVFPYHYIPSQSGFPTFSRHWRFAPSYLAAIRFAADWLLQLSSRRQSNKHMDYGCGDGGFVHALLKHEKLRSVAFSGVDFDQRAIQWAQAFGDNSGVFRCVDIHDLPAQEYDSGSLVEVFEHIPPAEGQKFIEGVARSLKIGAHLFITVPSTEKPLEKKHYRHFDFNNLQLCFGDHFEMIDCFGFEKHSTISKILSKVLMNRFIFIETPWTSRFLVRQMAKKSKELRGCGRICLIMRKI